MNSLAKVVLVAVGIAMAPVLAMTAAAEDCPLSSLAPYRHLAPVPGQCATPNCLVSFRGFQWWTSFQYWGPAAGFYNSGLQTAFAPDNVFVDAVGMHLRIAKKNLGGGIEPAGAEVVLMFNSDGSQADLGYGDYLVTAKILTARSWAALDPNVVAGFFTYQLWPSAGQANSYRELDMTEISRWGWNGEGACPFAASSPPLCRGNAQFTLQPSEALPANLHRYTIGNGVATITLVMQWHAGRRPVSFSEYDGAYTLKDLPSAASNQWTSSAAQDAFIPSDGCQRFHINMWNGNHQAASHGYDPPPRRLPQEIVVTNFEFRPE
jgi:hypothetical protein